MAGERHLAPRRKYPDFGHMGAPVAPAIFVALWSTVLVGTKYALKGAEPLTSLGVRLALVVGVMGLIAAIARPRWADRFGIGHRIVAGILVHGIYLGATA